VAERSGLGKAMEEEPEMDVEMVMVMVMVTDEEMVMETA
jgi:hypothetical protein